MPRQLRGNPLISIGGGCQTSAFCKAPDAVNANNLAPIYAWALYALSGDKRAQHGMMLLEEAMNASQKAQAKTLKMRSVLCR